MEGGGGYVFVVFVVFGVQMLTGCFWVVDGMKDCWTCALGIRES